MSQSLMISSFFLFQMEPRIFVVFLCALDGADIEQQSSPILKYLICSSSILPLSKTILEAQKHHCSCSFYLKVLIYGSCKFLMNSSKMQERHFALHQRHSNTTIPQEINYNSIKACKGMQEPVKPYKGICQSGDKKFTMTESQGTSATWRMKRKIYLQTSERLQTTIKVKVLTTRYSKTLEPKAATTQKCQREWNHIKLINQVTLSSSILRTTELFILSGDPLVFEAGVGHDIGTKNRGLGDYRRTDGEGLCKALTITTKANISFSHPLIFQN